MKRSITWEKWIDILPEENNSSIILDGDDNSEKDMFNNEEEFIEGNFEQFFEFNHQPLKINTPLGVYELNEPLSPSNMYDCWIGHTNFRIMDSDINVLENEIDGIEQIKVMSKYRFFIGVAKMFEFKNVRIDIDKKICKKPDHLNYKNSSWAMFLGNDGERKTIVKADEMSKEEFEEKIKKLKEIPNGCFIRSDNT